MTGIIGNYETIIGKCLFANGKSSRSMSSARMPSLWKNRLRDTSIFSKVHNIFPQPAVEALSEREAQLALRNEIENGNIDDFIDSDDFDWNNGEWKLKIFFVLCFVANCFLWLSGLELRLIEGWKKFLHYRWNKYLADDLKIKSSWKLWRGKVIFSRKCRNFFSAIT